MSSKKVAAVTITYNRLDLTKQTLESFNSKTGVDFHLFVDNGSTDGTVQWLDDYHHICLDKNYGIAYAFTVGVNALEGFDYILKLDNDIETVTEDIINKILWFYEKAGNNYAISPIDMLIDPNFYPVIISKSTINDQNVEFVSHTGGAFQIAASYNVQNLCREYKHLKQGDYMIGHFYRRHQVHPIYLKDLQMKHIGLDKGTPRETYIM